MKERPLFYKLEGTKAVPSDLEGADKVFQSERRVCDTTIGDTRVSTVFLGVDCALIGPPVLFETFCFGGSYDGDQERYSTWDEAETGHKRWVERVTTGEMEK